MNKQIRRVVTGHDVAGRSIVVSDGPVSSEHVDAREPGFKSTDLWRTFESPVQITATANEPTLGPRRQRPPAHGSVLRINCFPPESESIRSMTAGESAAFFAALGNEKGSTFERSGRHPLMHRTETVDYAIVLSGEITMVMDDGHVDLSAGDVVIQRGTNHAWSNRSQEPCIIAFILMDGRFDPKLEAKLP
jgi:mannose-6-phosphate isomerase-like protein (cupin superfamily)